jgi:hypothetical protein
VSRGEETEVAGVAGVAGVAEFKSLLVRIKLSGSFRETGRQETGDRRQETGDRRQETGDRRQETGDRRPILSPDQKMQAF